MILSTGIKILIACVCAGLLGLLIYFIITISSQSEEEKKAIEKINGFTLMSFRMALSTSSNAKFKENMEPIIKDLKLKFKDNITAWSKCILNRIKTEKTE